jgi:lincosamide nucleotidyltransferase A/C/D/E
MARAVYEERDPRRAMSAPDLAALLELFDAEGITVWLDGGWGVDALLEQQTRQHDDLDLVLAMDDVPRVVQVLERKRYDVAKGELPTCIVLLDPEGRQVDLHPVRFDESGDGSTRWKKAEPGRTPPADSPGAGTSSVERRGV